MEIRRLWTDPVWDIFYGYGWNNWFRVHRVNNELIIIKGQQNPPPYTLKLLSKILLQEEKSK